MLWQDIVISGASIIFVLALIPQAIAGFRKKKGTISLWTSGPTFLGLFAVSLMYYTLSLTFSTIVVSFTATMWLILFLQTALYK